jgi:hypothetical protein
MKTRSLVRMSGLEPPPRHFWPFFAMASHYFSHIYRSYLIKAGLAGTPKTRKVHQNDTLI